jgi:hypothetical protein
VLLHITSCTTRNKIHAALKKRLTARFLCFHANQTCSARNTYGSIACCLGYLSISLVCYRPISVTSIIARMYERLHMKSLLQHMKNSGIPSPSQFGFTKHRSTHDAIYRLLSTIVDTMGTGIGNFIPTVFVFYMLRALLTNRTMQVVHNNMISTIHILSAGVPQGSVPHSCSSSIFMS